MQAHAHDIAAGSTGPHAPRTPSARDRSRPTLREIVVAGLMGAVALLLAYVQVLRGAVNEGRELNAADTVQLAPAARCQRIEDPGERRDCLAEAERLAPGGAPIVTGGPVVR